MKKQVSFPFDPVILTILLLFAAFIRFVMGSADDLLSPHFGVVHMPETSEVMVQDFSNVYHYVKGVFLGISEHPYRVEEMNAMLSEWTQGAPNFMPFLSPPTSYLTMGPLTIFPPGVACLIWTIVSVFGTAWMVQFSKKVTGDLSWNPLILGYIAYFSITTLMAFNLGQTTFMTNAALVGLLFLRIQRKQAIVLPALILIFLTGKPQVSLVAVFFMLATSQWKALFWASLGCLLVCLLFTPRLGWTWPIDYIQTMSSYGTETAAIEIRDTIGTLVMTNLRSFLVEMHITSDRLACLISWVFLLSNGFGLIVLRLLRPSIPIGLIFSLSGIIYLLWSPHLNGYEDLLLLPIVYGAMTAGFNQRKHIFLYAAVLILGIQLNMDMTLGFAEFLRPLHHVFVTKLAFYGYLIFLVVRTHPDLRQRQLT